MNSKDRVKQIMLISVLFLVLGFIVALLWKQTFIEASGLLVGGAMSLLSFVWIDKSSRQLLRSDNPKRAAIMNYMVRYILYGVVFYGALKAGCNVVLLLLGFSSLSFAIKLSILLEKEKPNG